MTRTFITITVLVLAIGVTFSAQTGAHESTVAPAKEWTGIVDTEGFTQIWVIYSEDGSGLE